jgi:peptidoglycan/LPS O-acetylase OafA/YrhL
MTQGHTRDGSFDTLRLIAALMVFHSHSFAIANLQAPQLPAFLWGSAAVVIFFAMSGYWVSRSALERSVASFTAARALRIVPGLFVCGLVTIVICALATSENIRDYFHNRDTWRWLQNAFPLLLPQRNMLPGVFEDGVGSHPNGSLWTLPMEVLCYLAALVAARFGPRGMRMAIALAAVFTVGVVCGPIGVGDMKVFGDTMNRLWLALFAGAFFLGAAFNAARNRTLIGLIAVAGLWLLVPPRSGAAVYGIGMVLYSSLAILIGRNLNLDRLVTRGRDLSYGVYIYAFPIEQLSVRIFTPHDRLSFALYWGSALLATLGLAWLSWEVVEKPALRLKARLAGVIERGVGRLPLAAIRLRPVRNAA